MLIDYKFIEYEVLIRLCNNSLLNITFIAANLSVTPFARCVVPPPMSAYVLNVPSPIHAAMFGSEERVNDVLVLSIDGSLHWFSHLSGTALQTLLTKMQQFSPTLAVSFLLIFFI